MNLYEKNINKVLSQVEDVNNMLLDCLSSNYLLDTKLPTTFNYQIVNYNF